MAHPCRRFTERAAEPALSVDAGPDVRAEPRQSFLFEEREWLTLTPRVSGEHEVELYAGGVLARTITVVAIDPSEVAEVRLHGMDESNAGAGAILTVLGQAYDAEGEPVYGATMAWALDGETERGLGDLFRYELRPGAIEMLTAEFDGMLIETEIQANEGWVDSTYDIGCSVGASRQTRAMLPLSMLALGAVFFLRRARRGRA